MFGRLERRVLQLMREEGAEVNRFREGARGGNLSSPGGRYFTRGNLLKDGPLAGLDRENLKWSSLRPPSLTLPIRWTVKHRMNYWLALPLVKSKKYYRVI